jgi:hypothetical protein
MAEAPELVRVSGRDWLLPVETFPKLRLGVESVRVGAPVVTAVPDNGTERFEFVAFDVMASVPVSVPADCGAQVMLILALCPGPTVIGRLIAAMENPAPDTTAWLRVTLELPALVMVAVDL